MKTSLPEPPNYSAKDPAVSQGTTAHTGSRAKGYSVTGASRLDSELGHLAFAGKAGRMLIQLVHGLMHIRKLGLPGPEESGSSLQRRARDLHRLSAALLEHLQVEPVVSGIPPDSGLLVSNHISFLDIMLLSGTCPMVFIAKSEVAHWPLVGPIASAAGTLFVQRSRRTDVARVNASLRRLLQAGVLVTLFPEGTSSDGTAVLPFQPSLLQPAVETALSVTPAYLSYIGLDGERADDIAYFGDRDLTPCLAALLRRRRTYAKLSFGPSQPSGGCRKELARNLHAKVSELGGMQAH